MTDEKEYVKRNLDFISGNRVVKEVYYDKSTGATALEIIKELLFELRVPNFKERHITGEFEYDNVIELNSENNKILLVFDSKTKELKCMKKILLPDDEKSNNTYRDTKEVFQPIIR